VKVKEKYSVDIFRLKPGIHTYTFPVTDDFFANFDNSPVDKASGKVDLELNKQDSLIEATLHFDVNIPLVCDRSLRDYKHLVNEDHLLHFKFGEEEAKIDEDVYMITTATQRIDFSQFIYEFIILAVPMKKIHPDLDDDEEVIYQSESENDEDRSDDPVDPRWEALKKLKKD